MNGVLHGRAHSKVIINRLLTVYACNKAAGMWIGATLLQLDGQHPVVVWQ